MTNKNLSALNKILINKDQINSGLFQIYKIITTDFPNIDISNVIQIQYIFNNSIQDILNKVINTKD